MRNRHGFPLRVQALRLPPHARDRLTALTIRLRASGADVAAAKVARGLCALALELASGRVGTATAAAFGIAASDPAAVRSAVNAFVLLLDTEPPTVPLPADVGATRPREGRRSRARRRLRLPLDVQALRLLEPAQADLDALARGAGVKPAEAMRGLCLLALELVSGAAGAEVADAMCIAAIDPTPAGSQRAIEALRALLDGPPTIPAPSVAEPPPPSTQRAA